MEQRFTQISTSIIVTMLLAIALFIFMIYITDSDLQAILLEIPIYILISFAIIFLVVLLLFYKMTIVISNDKLTFFLGIGLIRRSYNIADIEQYHCIKISAFDVGIKVLKNGWRYTVGGNKALELRFRDRDTIVQIGTKDCENICKILDLLK